jgi:hypothetical protein
MPSHTEKERQLKAAQRVKKQAGLRGRADIAGGAREAITGLGQVVERVAGVPQQTGRLPQPGIAPSEAARERLVTSRQPTIGPPDIAQRIAGGAGADAGQAGIGEVLGGEPGREDYVPQAQRTPEQQQAAFQQVVLQHPQRYAGGDVAAPESRLGAFNAAGERIPVTYKRGGKTYDEAGQPAQRTVFDQLRSMRELREGDKRSRLERAAGADVSLKQSLGGFLSAAGKRKFAQKRLLAAEKADVERESIAGRLGAASVAAGQKAGEAARKGELAERKFALDVAEFGGLERYRGEQTGLAREKFGEESFRGRVGMEQRGAEIREKVVGREQRLGAGLRELEQKYISAGMSAVDSPEYRREALPRMIEMNPRLGQLLEEKPELAQELLNSPDSFRQLLRELEGGTEE